MWLVAQKSLNCCPTAEARCPPCYDDVLLGTFSGITGQGVAHCHVPLLGWQAAVQVEARVGVSFRVQLKDDEAKCRMSIKLLLVDSQNSLAAHGGK